MPTMIEEYFNKLEEYTRIYGDKIMLLWQCGSFFEIYGLKNKTTGELTDSHIKAYASILDMAIAPKKVKMKGKHKNKELKMSGYNICVPLEKYVPKLNKEGFTVIVWEEVGDDVIKKGKLRQETGIFSIGTNFDIQTKELTNTIMCIWIESFQISKISKKPKICLGFACIDIFTGNVNLFQYTKQSNNIHEPCVFDDFERFVSIYKPKEIIIIHNYENKIYIEDIINFTGIRDIQVKKINLNEKENINTIPALKCEKQLWQEELLNKYYDIKDFAVFYESNRLKEYPWATQSLVYLIYYIEKHNPNLVLNLNEPKYDNTSNNLLLATHSLKQLNIIDSGQNHTNSKLSNLERFLNRCATPVGERLFSYNLLHPKTDIQFLKKEYEITSYILENYDAFEEIRKKLKSIKDIEKYERKIILNKITPNEITELYSNISVLLEAKSSIKNHKIVDDYINKNIDIDIVKKCKKLKKFLNKYINFKKAIEITNKTYDVNFFNKKVFHHLDDMDMEYVENMQKIIAIQKYLSCLVETKEKKNVKIKSFIRLKDTQKSGLWMEATSKRSEIIKLILKKQFTHVDNMDISLEYKSKYDNTAKKFNVSFNNFKAVKTTQNYCKLSSSTINKVYDTHLQSANILSELIEQCYNDFLTKLKEFIKEINIIIKFTGIIDLIITKAFIARKFRYCKPIIEEADKSYLNAREIRHPLIEHINQNELYVPNDVSLGIDNTDGILLYGTNAVGKSSLIKSIGMAVIMAQAGLFVPCSEFIYNPYKVLSTRILGNDNIFKGLSSFGVEISELKTIHELADKNSLILGDELCSGTENKSAIIIFTGSLDMLSKRQSSYIFATHFHKLATVQRVKKIHTLKMKHLSVIYDEQNDRLIYDRQLKDGTGRNMYGLEVCKSMGLSKDFMDTLNVIHNEVYPEDKPLLENNKSRYNLKKIKNKCELCGSKGEEIHHLNPQEYADNLGNIRHFKKNHTANLINICKSCHKTVTKHNIIHKKVKTSNGYELIET